MAQEHEPRADGGEGREFSGKTVDDAISKALTEFGLRHDQVDVTVLSEGRPGILGVGAQPARVLVTPRTLAAPPPAAPRAAEPAPRRAPRTTARPEPAERRAPRTAFDDDASFLTETEEAEPAGEPMALDLVTESAVDVLQTMLQLMGIDATVTTREPVTPGDGAGMMSAVLDVTGVDESEVGLLVGRRGETLAAMQ